MHFWKFLRSVKAGVKLAFEAGILSIIIALIRRGRLRLLADMEIKGLWLIIFQVFIIFISVMTKRYMDVSLWVRLAGWLHILSSIVLLIFFWVNRRLPGMKWFLAGWFLNLFPIAFNAGKMPVSRPAASIAGIEEVLSHPDMMRHVVMSDVTRFNFLADIFPMPILIAEVFSVGDVLMTVGIFILIQVTMCPRKPKTSPMTEEG